MTKNEPGSCCLLFSGFFLVGIFLAALFRASLFRASLFLFLDIDLVAQPLLDRLNALNDLLSA